MSHENHQLGPQENSPDVQQLKEAFGLFSRASGELIHAYSDLQKQLATLSAQLEMANLALASQSAQRASLAERLALLLDALPAGVVELAADGTVLRQNPAAQDMAGADWTGLDWAQVSAAMTPADVGDAWLLPSGAAPREVIVEQRPLPDGSTIVLLHDISRQQALARQLADQERLVAMGQMAASLAHQLRTPLATAMLYTANLAREPLGREDRERFAGKALDRLRQLEGLIRDTLGYVRGEAFELHDVAVADVLDEVEHAVLAGARARAVTFACRQDTGVTRVRADARALVSALVSLIENAFAYSSPGSEVSLAVRRGEAGVEFAVSDQGPGVPAEIASRIFEPFFTTRSEGTGLGLAIAARVAQQQGGQLRLDARHAPGACFVLSLPLADD
ncbi:sensor histidine kinase FleS [Microvirgula curvata]|uniref:histidine kinase n=1 Tax=Microvirgula aerodenitrificans TaxID=57480 RepID=A0A2S0P796_9NEIS|nr:sensor histidine kinase [Microvirgula aerodenitrificans]RAS19760.1 two-component system sensor histidine kinase FlrB [Microvirgula sp. AG722]